MKTRGHIANRDTGSGMSQSQLTWKYHKRLWHRTEQRQTGDNLLRVDPGYSNGCLLAPDLYKSPPVNQLCNPRLKCIYTHYQERARE